MSRFVAGLTHEARLMQQLVDEFRVDKEAAKVQMIAAGYLRLPARALTASRRRCHQCRCSGCSRSATYRPSGR